MKAKVKPSPLSFDGTNGKVIVTLNRNAAGKTISHAITQSLTPNIEI